MKTTQKIYLKYSNYHKFAFLVFLQIREHFKKFITVRRYQNRVKIKQQHFHSIVLNQSERNALFFILRVQEIDHPTKVLSLHFKDNYQSFVNEIKFSLQQNWLLDAIVINKYLYYQKVMELFVSNAKKIFPKVICVGKNYIEHVKEMGGSQAPKTPVIFLKPWTTVNYDPKILSLPSSAQHRIDHELELGVFIEKGGKNIAQQDAMGHVGGYFIGIDFSDRDFQNEAKSKGMPWALAKCQDNFCPVSPLFSKENDPYSVELQLRVNNQTRQRDLTGKMHFKIDEIISYVSQYIALNDGDLLMTGTPAGVGSVKKGDQVEAFARQGAKLLTTLAFEVTE